MPDVTYDKKYELLYCRIKPNPRLPMQSVTMADSEHVLVYNQKEGAERSETVRESSQLTVVADYDQDGDLAGVEILGLPAKKPA